ncbi:MAG: SUMF1/EgtB/PvdO family nonheme iron enzyme [Burkholderiales bacterium]
MRLIQVFLAAVLLLITLNTHAASYEEAIAAVKQSDQAAAASFMQDVAAPYRAANPKPSLPEEAHKYRVQAEFALQNNQFIQASDLYAKALALAPWWPQGHFDRALVLGETKAYWDAIHEMQRYLLLVPDAPDARKAQDMIYQWESVAGSEPSTTGITFSDCANCPEMVVIPAGSFDMGSNNGKANEQPVHHVTIAQAFAIGKTEVTQGQWKDIMGNNPSHFSSCGDNCPVEQVSWNDIQVFIQKLSVKTGKQYRLPSEAEWEYACRAGSRQKNCGSDNLDSVAWYAGNSGGTTHPVATKQANAWGLYDMCGNVWEWVEDSWHDNYDGAPADGSAWQGNGALRVLRGDSWININAPQYMRETIRIAIVAAHGYSEEGFRLARTLP